LSIPSGNIKVCVRSLKYFLGDQTIFPVNYYKYFGLIVSELKPILFLFLEFSDTPLFFPEVLNIISFISKVRSFSIHSKNFLYYNTYFLLYLKYCFLSKKNSFNIVSLSLDINFANDM
jgi:hypothetical protein